MTRKRLFTGNHKRAKSNASKICFACGKIIFNRRTNACYCKTCSEVVKDITALISNAIHYQKLKQKFGPYTFKVQVQIVKRREGENYEVDSSTTKRYKLQRNKTKS